MTEITLPDLQVWWTWLPLYVPLIAIIVGVIIASIVEYGSKGYALAYTFVVGLLVSVVTLVVTSSSFESVKNDAIREVLATSEGWSNFVWTDEDSDVDEFVAENQEGEFISGFVVERQGKIGFVLDN